MKKLIIFLNSSFLVLHSVFAQYQVSVDRSGALQFPQADEFKSANAIASFNGVQVNIDTTPSVNAADATKNLAADIFIMKNADLNMGASISGGWTNVSATKGVWQASKGDYSCYYVNNYDLTGDAEAASLGINYAVALATTHVSGVPITQQFYNNKLDLSQYAGKSILIKYSLYAKKLYDGDVSLNLATLGATLTNLTNIKSFGSSLVYGKWEKLEGNLIYTVPARIDGTAQRIGFTATKAENGSVALAKFSFEIFNRQAIPAPKLTSWTDGEFKVLDADGNLIYWVSTQRGAQTGGEYEANSATDLNAKIFYTCPENENNGAGKGREWIEFIYNSANARTIYEHAQGVSGSSTPTIGGIIIQPNFNGTTVGGTSIKSIFGSNGADAPEGNQYIYLKCSPTNFEKTADGKPVWRTTLPMAIQ